MPDCASLDGDRSVAAPCWRFDAETRFRALAARGSVKQGLALLDKLDADFAAKAK